MLLMNYTSGSESQVESYQEYSTSHLSNSVARKHYYLAFANVHLLEYGGFALATSTGLTMWFRNHNAGHAMIVPWFKVLHWKHLVYLRHCTFDLSLQPLTFVI